MTLLPQIVGFAVTIAALSALSRWISQLVQIVGWRLSGDERAAVVIYYLLLLPGIVLHELSHALMAALLGLKVGSFTLGPRAQGRYVQLGSVTVGSGGPLRDSLVGLAPFISGTGVLLLICYQVFNVGALGQAWLIGGWSAVLRAVPAFSSVPDFWLWAYFLFCVSNAMMPSPADRKPWLLAGLYVALALVVAYFVGVLALAAQTLGPELAGALPALTVTFLFTLGLDLVVAVVLLTLDALTVLLQR